jgi:hypothetical protein
MAGTEKRENHAQTPRLAVLIDADNAQPSIAENLFLEIARLGEATVKRVYGDFTSSGNSSWIKRLREFAIKPVQQFANASGKNATDSSLIIDAMDLLYTGNFDGFCLVSSDSDFTGLAVRLREAGLKVYGFGEEKTPLAFRNACHKFTLTEILRQTKPVDGGAVPAYHPEPTLNAVIPKQKGSDENSSSIFLSALKKAVDGDGWASLSQFGAFLRKEIPGFKPANYGFKKLCDLVRGKKDLFDIEERKVSGSNKNTNIFLRPRAR